MTHHRDQPAGLCVVLADHRVANPPQPQGAQALALLEACPDGAAHLGDLEVCHGYAVPSRTVVAASASLSRRAFSIPAGATSSIGSPRRAATSSGRCRSLSAATVACTTLMALSLPNDLARMSCTPAHSSTARAAPPAITPVPGLAGRNSTTPAAARPGRRHPPPPGGCPTRHRVSGAPADQRHPEEALARLLDALGNRGRDFLGLAVADADHAVAVTHDDQSGEAESPPTLDHLG